MALGGTALALAGYALERIDGILSLQQATFLLLYGCCGKFVLMNEIKEKLQVVAPGIFERTPVLVAYLYGSYVKSEFHSFSDLDIGIYVEDMDAKACLDLELSLALHFDEKLNHSVQSEVRILNHLPLPVKGRILGEAMLIYSRDEEKRVAFETQVRKQYFDFLPVIRQYRHTYRQKTIAESQHGIY